MNKFALLGVLVVLRVAFATGRYSVTANTDKTATKQVDDKKTHTQTTTTTTKSPTGEIKTVITTDTVSVVNKKKDIVKAAPAPKQPITNVSLLVAYDFSRPSGLIYGISATKEIAGPITAGVYGLSNGTLGVSVGMNF